MSAKTMARVLVAGMLGLLLVVAALALPALVASPGAAEAQGPEPGTVVGVGTYVAYPTTALSNAGSVTTTYSAAPRLVSGLDVSYARNWNSADAWVILAGFGGTDKFTVTAQLSPDQSNWADAYYTFIGDTASSTSTMRPQTQTYRTVPAANGTTYFSFPIAGMYLRYKIEYSGTLTATVKTTYRNNGGR